MRKVILSAILFLPLLLSAQYVPIKPDSIKVTVKVNGIVRSIYMIDLIKNSAGNLIFIDTTTLGKGTQLSKLRAKLDSIRVLATPPLTGNIYVSSIDNRIKYKGRRPDGQEFWYTLAVQDSAMAGITNAEAGVYFTNAGITDATFKAAYENFVTATKAHGTYSKIYAFFPYAGTASQNSYDAITGISKVSFTAGWTHSNGVTPNGGVYANSGIPVGAVSQDNLGFFSYVMTSWGTTDTDDMLIGAKNASVTTYLYSGSGGIDGPVNTANADYGNISTTLPAVKTGLFATIRTSPTAVHIYHDGTLLKNASTTSATPIAGNFYIGANNRVDNGTVSNYSSTKQGATGILNGFTDADWISFASDLQTFMTAIGR